MWCCSLADTCASARAVLHCWQAVRVLSAAARCSAALLCKCELSVAMVMLVQPYNCCSWCAVIVSSSDKG